MKKVLRQELYYCAKYGIINHLQKIDIDQTLQGGINRIDGYVKYVTHIEKETLSNFRKMWRELLKKEVLSIGFETIEDKRGIRKIDIFVDEVEISTMALVI